MKLVLFLFFGIGIFLLLIRVVLSIGYYLNLMFLPQWFHKLVDLKSDAAPEVAYEQIKKDIKIRGAVLVYLICSAIIASVGLDTGSPAVIISS